jgi:hypothetical protein
MLLQKDAMISNKKEFNKMNKLKKIYNALATADRIEVTLDGSDTFIAQVNFCNETKDDNFYIDLRDVDDDFPPIQISKKQLLDSEIVANQIIVDSITEIELFKYVEHQI